MRMFSMGKNGAKQWLHATHGTKTDINENVFATKKAELKQSNDLNW